MARSSFGGTVKLTGESEYRKALKDITSSLRMVSSEMKLTATEFASGDKTVKQTKSSYDNMNKTVQEQKAKISELKTALEQAEEEYGSNNEKVKSFKTQLNNAEVQLKQMEDATDKSTKELKEMKKGFDDAGDSSLKFGDIIKANLVSSAVIGGIKMLGSAVKQLGSAMVNMGKQAIDSYAQYEQLVGGVETLFGTKGMTIEEYAKSVGKSVSEVKTKFNDLQASENAVLENSKIAFRTAGMSANQYMETVTTFSASLLQGLGGDTKKATEISDMAIIDMSDNANKMGTSMESIMNAYQGFSKQNYTMLDNLKLGYGGTKAEMQRLLADAEKLTGKKYDLSNLADVYEAIHAIQNEMGITGTTVKEAEETIEGSTKMMSASWQNLLTGIADDEADFDTLVKNFVDSFVIMANNIVPRIEIALSGIIDLVVQLIDQLLPQILEMGTNLITNLVKGMTEGFPSIIQGSIQAVLTVIQTIAQLLPQILEMGVAMIVELSNGLATQIPTLIPMIVDTVLMLAENIVDNIDTIIDAGIQLIIGLAKGLIDALPQLIEKIPVIINKLIDAIINNMAKIIEMGIQIVVQLAFGLIKAIPSLVKAVPQLIKAIVKALGSGVILIAKVGKDLVKGIWNGISDATSWLLNKIKGFGKTVLNGIKKIFGIHSPSKVFRDEVGKNLALGVGEGFEDTMKRVSEDMASSIPTQFDASVNVGNPSSGFSFNSMVLAFKKALSEMKVELDDREVGTFVTRTVERQVFA